MAQLRDKSADFKKAGGWVVLVGMGPPKESGEFLEKFAIPFPMVCDPERKLYDAYGLKRMGVLDFLSPTLALKSFSAVAEGNLVGIPEGDVKQLAGAFIIDSSGYVRFRHLSADPADFPPAGDLLAALESIS
ncbi:MAG: redoxin domain-containing protein [Deltaproteobacteria bacterium]|nr:redoxin domain-containing protein [Deltaproteobacteria bacterium]